MRRVVSISLLVLAHLALASPVARALGTEALIYVAPSALTVSYGNLEAQLRAAGATQVETVGAWPLGTDLAARFRLVVLTPHGGPLEPAVATDLRAFVARGGGVVVMSEHDFGELAGNALAMELGLAARFDVRDTGGGCASTDALAASHRLTVEAPTLEFAWAREVTGGTVLYGTLAPVATIDGTVVLVGDSDVFSDPVAFGGCGVGPSTERFYRNLFTSLPDDTVGMMDADGGAAGPDAGTGGGLGDPCGGNTDCASGLCATEGARSYCTTTCTGACPAGYRCTAAGAVSVCAIAPPASSGCAAAPTARSELGLALAVLALAAAQRRRSRRAST